MPKEKNYQKIIKKTSPQQYLFMAVIGVIFVLSFLYSIKRNLHKGVYMDDLFFYVTESTLLKADDQNQIRFKSNDSDIDFTVTLDGVTQSANLNWDNGYVTITYEGGPVVKGDWDGEYIMDKDGEPAMINSDELTVSSEEKTQLLGFYQNSALSHTLCQISRNKTVNRNSILTICLGIAFYLIGALEFLYPETYHFFLRGWKYNRQERTKGSAISEKVGAIVVMIIGFIALTGIFIS